MREPYCKDAAVVATLTPRQTWDIYFAKRDEETGAVQPPAKDDDDPPVMSGQQAPWMKYECWKPLPGEKEEPENPFIVPREVVKERTFTLMYEVAKRGGFPQRVRVVNDGPDMDQLQDYFEEVWAANQAEYPGRCEQWRKTHGIPEDAESEKR